MTARISLIVQGASLGGAPVSRVDSLLIIEMDWPSQRCNLFSSLRGMLRRRTATIYVGRE